MATMETGKTITGAMTDIWCAPGTKDASAIDFQCNFQPTPNVSEFPKLFGGERLTFRRGVIRGVHVTYAGQHVEGLQINGCRHVLFEDILFEDNDVMHVFLTSYGGLPMPDHIYFNRCRFGEAGPLRDANGVSMYWSVNVRDTSGEGAPIRMSNMNFYDCQVRGAPIRRENWTGTFDVVSVPDSQPWPAFKSSGELPPPWVPTQQPPPPPPTDDSVRLDKLDRIHSVLHDSTLTHKARVMKANAIIHE